MSLEGKVKQPYRCKICDDDYYAVYKDFKNTCASCAIKSPINEKHT